jgi:hypothetical protein
LDGKINVARCLMNDLGADVNLADEMGPGRTPMNFAAQGGFVDLMRCLVKEFGADPNQGDATGVVAFRVAAYNGDLDAMQCLSNELGADVGHKDNEGRTASFFAANEGHFAVVRCLVREYGADVNHRSNLGDTVLMVAARRKHAALAKWLVKAGADPQAKHPTEGTAADISRAAGASPEQTVYLEAKAHCAQPGCSGAGTKKCQGCMQGRYCGQACRVAHWPEHNFFCRQLSAATQAKQAKQDFLECWGVVEYEKMKVELDKAIADNPVRLSVSISSLHRYLHHHLFCHRN